MPVSPCTCSAAYALGGLNISRRARGRAYLSPGAGKAAHALGHAHYAAVP